MTSTTRYVSLKDTNVAIRKALKAAFPGVKFSVVGDSYSMGASTNVSWVDGPAAADVDAVVKPFQSKGVMQIDDYVPDVTVVVDGQRTMWGADYVFTNRTISPEVTAALTAEVAGMLGLTVDEFDPRRWYAIPEALGMSMAYGDECGATMVRWLAEARSAAPAAA